MAPPVTRRCRLFIQKPQNLINIEPDMAISSVSFQFLRTKSKSLHEVKKDLFCLLAQASQLRVSKEHMSKHVFSFIPTIPLRVHFTLPMVWIKLFWYTRNPRTIFKFLIAVLAALYVQSHCEKHSRSQYCIQRMFSIKKSSWSGQLGIKSWRMTPGLLCSLTCSVKPTFTHAFTSSWWVKCAEQPKLNPRMELPQKGGSKLWLLIGRITAQQWFVMSGVLQFSLERPCHCERRLLIPTTSCTWHFFIGNCKESVISEKSLIQQIWSWWLC